jgi:hypothetical protein
MVPATSFGCENPTRLRKSSALETQLTYENLQCVLVNMLAEKLNVLDEVKITWTLWIVVRQDRCASMLHPEFIPSILQAVQIRFVAWNFSDVS